MESSYGPSCGIKQQNHNSERKRQSRAPSPARPLLKDINSRSPARPPGIAPQSPKLSHKPPTSAGLLATPSRVSRRFCGGEKEKATLTKCNTRTVTVKKAIKIVQQESEQKVASKQIDTTQNLIKGKKGRNHPATESDKSSLVYGSPICVPTGVCLGTVTYSDSSSDLSDCPSEPLMDEQRFVQTRNSNAQCNTVHGFCDQPTEDNERHATATPEQWERAGSPERAVEPCATASADAQGTRAQGHCSRAGPESAPLSTPVNANGPTHCTTQGNRVLLIDDLLREIEELRSENDYLKDEVEELRAEMEEARDSYLEEEMRQLQELRHELDAANRSCRILQYRLRKAEQRTLQVAQAGQDAEGGLLRTLEQDLKVAKDVSMRLHNELESVEERRSRAEDENEVLRQKIVEVEITKQALQNNLERLKESSLKRRGSRDLHKEKKSVLQEDNADLKCQLQFIKEESSLMRKKIVKLGREKDELEEELQKYKCVYGDVDCALPTGECRGPPSTWEAELKLRLKLVEEEATILGRKVVELEVENRELRSENEDVRSQYEQACLGREPVTVTPSSPCGGALESAADMRRHLQFVEEEAELLRRSISETEDRNKQLTSELGHVTLGHTQEGDDSEGACFTRSRGQLQEDLNDACQKINELRETVIKLQYENRVLLSGVPHCDLDSPDDTEGHSGKKDSTDEDAATSPQLHPKREGPVGGESDSEDGPEKTFGLGCGQRLTSCKLSSVGQALEMFISLKHEAEHLGKAVDHLITDTDCLVYDGKLLLTARGPVDGQLGRGRDLAEGECEPQGLDAISAHMKTFKSELHSFIEKADLLGKSIKESLGTSHPLSGITDMSHDSPHLPMFGTDPITKFQPEVCRTAGETQVQMDHGSYPSHMEQETEDRQREQEMLRQELRFLRHSTAHFYTRLCRLIEHWRRGRRSNGGKERTLIEELDNIPEPDVLMDQVEGRAESRTSNPCDSSYASEPFQTTELHQNQLGNNHQLLHALQVLLEEFLLEIQDEEEQCYQLQQICTNEKTAWEMQWTDLNHIKQGILDFQKTSRQPFTVSGQPESGREMALSGGPEPLKPRDSLSQKQKVTHAWDSQMRAFQQKTEELQRSLNVTLAESPQLEQREHCGTTSAQDSPTDPVNSRAHPVTNIPSQASRTHQPTKNLFLDALLLDSPRENTASSPSKLDGKKNFLCFNEAANETKGRKDHSVVQEEDMGGGGLLRVKSVCSMSDFQRLIDSSPFLPEKNIAEEEAEVDELTPPLSPDDLKYIEEFNSKEWEFPRSQNTSGTTEVTMEARAEDRESTERISEPFQPASWFGNKCVTITTDTLHSPDHCQDESFHYGILSHNSEDPMMDPVFELPATKAKYSESKGTAKGVYEQWPCGPQKHQKDTLEGRVCPVQPPVSSTVGLKSSLQDIGLTQNLSDDMKEVAFSVRNTLQDGSAVPQLKHAACQTNSVATRATQTTLTVSVGLQTECLRNITSSPHKCLTPKGGSTPVSSPSRTMKRMLLSPVVQSKFERSCCSPKCSSPLLQRKAFFKADQSGSRTATTTIPQKGFSESAWARSTTTRDSPVHTTIKDGLSSLFNIIDHSPMLHDAPQRFTKSPSCSRPNDPKHPDTNSSKARSAQKQVQEGSPSPLQFSIETKGKKSPEVISIRQELQNPLSCTLTESTSRSPHKKLLVTHNKGDIITAGGNAINPWKEGKLRDIVQLGTNETHAVLLTPPWRL